MLATDMAGGKDRTFMRRIVLFAVLGATTVISVGFCWVGAAVAALPAVETTALNWGQQNYLVASHYSTIVLGAVMHDSIASLKAANPSVKVLMYDNVAFTTNSDCANTRSSAVSYCDAIANHPSWFLRTSVGQPMEACSPAGYYWMDVGNAAYRSAVAADAVTRAKALGFDGVMLDDVDTFPGHCETGGGLLSATPSYSDEAWGAAMVGLMGVVGPAVKKAGMVADANVAADPWTSYQEADMLTIATYSTRIAEEHWLQWQCSTCTVFTGSMWLDYLNELEGVQDQGAGFAASTYSDGTAINNATILYTRATLMLGWNGSGGDTYDYHVLCTCSNNYSSYASLSAGSPTDSRYQVGVAWRRDFTDGVALVDPSPTVSQPVNLGACYVSPGGSHVTELTLSPATGTILTKC